MTDSKGRNERRRAALNAAQDLLARDGISGLSMRRLARASKMAVNTLYAMFSTRDGILEALVQDAAAHRLEALRAVQIDSNSPIDHIEALIITSAHHAIQNPERFKTMYRAASELRHLKQLAHSIIQKMFLPLLQEAVDAGELRSDVALPPLIAMLMQSVNEHFLAWALDEISDQELEARCRYILAIILTAAASPAHTPVLHQRLREATARLDALHNPPNGAEP